MGSGVDEGEVALMPGRVAELVFRGDNRSAIRAITQIAEKSDSTTRKLQQNNRKTSESFRGVGDSAKHVHSAVAGLAGTVGLGGLAFGIKDVLQGGMKLQAQQAQLQGALRATGNRSVETARQLQEVAQRTSTHGGFATSENLQALTQFITATGNAGKAQRDLGLATDISRRSGKDFTTTVRALMMLENGRTTGLARLGLAIPKVTTAQDKLRASGQKISPALMAQAKAQDTLASKQQAFASLQARFGGATATFANSTAGRISNMKNTWQNLVDELGKGLLPVMNRVLKVVASLVGWLTKHRAVLYGLLAATAAVTGILTAHFIAVETARAASIAWAGAQKVLGLVLGETAVEEEAATGATIGLGAAMDALPILAIIAGLVLLVTHFDLVKKGAIIAFHWIEGAAKTAWTWIKHNWPLLLGILLAPFTGGVSIIIGLFHKQLLGAVKAVWNWIKHNWPLLLAILTGPIGLAVWFTVKHFNQIVSVAKTVVSTLGSIFKTVFNVITWPFKEAFKIIKGIFNNIVSDVRWVVDKIKGAFSWIGKTAGSVLHTVSFGLLHGGGPVQPKYFAHGGPSGSDTIPGWLSPHEYVLNPRMVGQAGIGNLERWRTSGQLGGMGGGAIEIAPAPVIINLDGRKIAEAVVQYQRKRAARGASSLVGGAMNSGVTPI